MLKVVGARLLIPEAPITEHRHQFGTPQHTSDRNFVPKRDLKRYFKRGRNCSWNRNNSMPGTVWPISQHSVERGVAFGSGCG
jgi:hypothetical protein